MANWFSRAFSPSDSDNQSGAQYNAAYNASSLPAAPSMANSLQAGKDAALAKRKKLSKTILTGPEGLSTDFETSKKSLLGE